MTQISAQAALACLKDKPWRQPGFVSPAAHVRSMVTVEEQQFLHHLAQHYFDSALGGDIVDLGPFVGADTVVFADGLRRNPHFDAAKHPNKPIHAYDIFLPPENTKVTVNPDERNEFWDEYQSNVAPFADLVETHRGDILKEAWPAERPITILFNDITKSRDINLHVRTTFMPSMMPGLSVLVEQDYYEDHYFVPITMEALRDYFVQIEGPLGATAGFLYVKELSKAAIEQACAWDVHQARQLIRDVQKRTPGWYKRLLMMSEARMLIDFGEYDEAKKLVDDVEREYPDHRVLKRRIERSRNYLRRVGR